MAVSSQARESLQAVLRRPSLIAVEIGWRWTLGLTSFTFIWGLASWFVEHTPFVKQDLATLRTLDPQLIALALHDILTQAAGRILFVSLVLVVGLVIFWTIFAGAGRMLTLRMLSEKTPSRHEVRFSTVALSQALRAVVTVGCTVLFFAGMLFSALLSGPNPEAQPRWGLYILLVLVDIIVTTLLWGIGNWVFWLASITAAVHERFLGKTSSALSLARKLARAPAHLDLEIAFGLLRTALFIVVFLVSLLAAGLLTVSHGVLPWILLAIISLLYLAMADVLQIARVTAIVKLAEQDKEPLIRIRTADLSC